MKKKAFSPGIKKKDVCLLFPLFRGYNHSVREFLKATGNAPSVITYSPVARLHTHLR